MEAVSKIRKWGNSFGVLVPKDLIIEERLNEGDEVVVQIKKKYDLSRLFGLCKFKKPTSEIMREIREGYDD